MSDGAGFTGKGENNIKTIVLRGLVLLTCVGNHLLSTEAFP